MVLVYWVDTVVFLFHIYVSSCHVLKSWGSLLESWLLSMSLWRPLILTCDSQQSCRALQTRAEAQGRQSQRGTTKHIHWSFILFTDRRLQAFIRFVFIVCFMRVWQECETWLNVASCQEEYGMSMEEVDQSYTAALNCAERAAQSKLQVPHSPSCSTFIHCTCVQNAKNSIQTDC